MARKPKTECPPAPAVPLVAKPLNPYDPRVVEEVAAMKRAIAGR